MGPILHVLPHGLRLCGAEFAEDTVPLPILLDGVVLGLSGELLFLIVRHRLVHRVARVDMGRHGTPGVEAFEAEGAVHPAAEERQKEVVDDGVVASFEEVRLQVDLPQTKPRILVGSLEEDLVEHLPYVADHPAVKPRSNLFLRDLQKVHEGFNPPPDETMVDLVS